MSDNKHGTRFEYAAGCRCDKCTAANSAYAWAHRKVAEWDVPITEHFRNSGALVGKTVSIPAHILLQAIKRYEQQIKIEALSLFRRDAEGRKTK